MKAEFINGGMKITGEDIRPEIVFDCGQCFRFNPDGCGYTGVAHKKVLHAEKTNSGLFLYPCTQDDFKNIWFEYFDLGLCYSDIEESFKKDGVLAKTIECSKGMRLLVQEPFETLISFIISANNNIGRIKGIIERICALCGEEIEFEGGKYHAFPKPDVLAGLTEEQLKLCGAGYRAQYIRETSQVVAQGDFDLFRLYDMDYNEAKKCLITLKGVGPKVADCILLFAYGKKNAFPVDVWMRRVLIGMYGFEPKNPAQAEAFAAEHFGEYAGIAQQYLFNYARINRII